jgi:exosortase
MVIYFFFLVGFPNHMSQGFALIISLFGLVLLILGPRQTAPLFLPIAYLVFAVYISDKIMWEITFWLKQIASSGSSVVLTALGSIFGFEVEARGTLITVAGNPMDVADACSGMRTVMAFLALGAAVCLISCRLWWQRVWLLMLAIPVAIVLNIVRVVTLGLLSMIDPDLAGGQAHTLIGTILLVPGLIIFLLIVSALNRAVDDAPAEGAPA